MIEALNTMSLAYGLPKAHGQIKCALEDFYVEEHLGFELSGEGEHLYLLIEKKGLTTDELVKRLSHELNLPARNISYAGLKDKFAVTRQWFSLQLPGLCDPNLDGLQTNDCQVIKNRRHSRKLKIGALQRNDFVIKVKHFDYDEEDMLKRINQIRAHGVPNYYGPQRFGNQGSNLEHAKRLLFEGKKVKNRHLRGLYYSAARSFLFNMILSERITQNCWNTPVFGDAMMLAGSNSVFQINAVDDVIADRIDKHDIFPASCLWGEGEERLTGKAFDIQRQALEAWRPWCEALEAHNLKRAYRSMVLMPENLQLNGDTFTFSLPKGAFATTVLRELLTVK